MVSTGKNRGGKKSKRAKKGGTRKSVMKGGAYYVIKDDHDKILRKIDTGPSGWKPGTKDPQAIQKKLQKFGYTTLSNVDIAGKYGKDYSGSDNSHGYVTITRYKNAAAAAKEQKLEEEGRQELLNQQQHAREELRQQAETRHENTYGNRGYYVGRSGLDDGGHQNLGSVMVGESGQLRDHPSPRRPPSLSDDGFSDSDSEYVGGRRKTKKYNGKKGGRLSRTMRGGGGYIIFKKDGTPYLHVNTSSLRSSSNITVDALYNKLSGRLAQRVDNNGDEQIFIPPPNQITTPTLELKDKPPQLKDVEADQYFATKMMVDDDGKEVVYIARYKDKNKANKYLNEHNPLRTNNDPHTFSHNPPAGGRSRKKKRKRKKSGKSSTRKH